VLSKDIFIRADYALTALEAVIHLMAIHLYFLILILITYILTY